ncbi:MAG TPA: alpha-amylase family protein [Jatrophihabitans sp.]|jgi:alpha-amylase
MRRLSSRKLRILAAAGALALAGGITAFAIVPANASDTHHHGRVHDVSANLWEWNWPSVAKECTTVLGPSGYGSVQVAPPADSLSRDYTSSDAPIEHPWWDVYQPVDYNLTSRFGDEQQFRDMVKTCRAAGVKVIVDAVINHMTGQGHKSYGGVEYTHFSYPDYSYDNFHHLGTGPNDCDSSNGGIDDFNDFRQLTKCELLGLADLRTDDPATRAKIVGYLNKLIGYGVSGFRVDAAKHIGEEDLLKIEAGLHRTWEGTRPYMALEVFPGSPGEASQYAYTRAGSVLGFDASYQLKNAFKSYTTPGIGNITGLRVWGEDAGLMPTDKTLVFVENHDTERGSDTLSYKDGPTNTIANEFLLAYGYGTPQVYSSFDWTNTYDSPPADANGYVTDTDCSNGWVCVDRYQGVLGMVGWHNYVGRAHIRNWYDDGDNLIAFTRGGGFFSTNNHSDARTVTVQTGLPPGTYCDVIHGSVSHGTCSGPTVTVGRHGAATITVGGKDSVAFTRADRV